MQCAWQLTDHLHGFLLGKRYPIHDRDTMVTQAFDHCLRDIGIEPVVLSARSPNSNAYCERFVRSIKEEALDRMMLMGKRHSVVLCIDTSAITMPSAIIRDLTIS